MNRSISRAFLVTALVSGCASTVAVKPVKTPASEIDAVCIERNEEVLVDDLLPVIEAAFRRHIASPLSIPGQIHCVAAVGLDALLV